MTECHTFHEGHVHHQSYASHAFARQSYADRRDVSRWPQRRLCSTFPHYNFNWQITYRAREPIFIPKGTRMRSPRHSIIRRNNPLNPDPSKPMRWGSASESEMMDGWIEYVDATAPAEATHRTGSLDLFRLPRRL